MVHGVLLKSDKSKQQKLRGKEDYIVRHFLFIVFFTSHLSQERLLHFSRRLKTVGLESF